MNGHSHYWQIKAIELEGQVLQAEIRAQAAAFEGKRRATYEAAGLTYGQRYQLSDADQTITAVEAEDDAGQA